MYDEEVQGTSQETTNVNAPDVLQTDDDELLAVNSSQFDSEVSISDTSASCGEEENGNVRSASDRMKEDEEKFEFVDDMNTDDEHDENHRSHMNNSQEIEFCDQFDD